MVNRVSGPVPSTFTHTTTSHFHNPTGPVLYFPVLILQMRALRLRRGRFTLLRPQSPMNSAPYGTLSTNSRC